MLLSKRFVEKKRSEPEQTNEAEPAENGYFSSFGIPSMNLESMKETFNSATGGSAEGSIASLQNLTNNFNMSSVTSVFESSRSATRDSSEVTENKDSESKDGESKSSKPGYFSSFGVPSMNLESMKETFNSATGGSAEGSIASLQNLTNNFNMSSLASVFESSNPATRESSEATESKDSESKDGDSKSSESGYFSSFGLPKMNLESMKETFNNATGGSAEGSIASLQKLTDSFNMSSVANVFESGKSVTRESSEGTENKDTKSRDVESNGMLGKLNLSGLNFGSIASVFDYSDSSKKESESKEASQKTSNETSIEQEGKMSQVYKKLAKRELTKSGLDDAKQMLDGSGYRLKSPPLASYQTNIQSLEPYFHSLTDAVRYVPDLNVKMMESVLPKVLSESQVDSVMEKTNACMEMVVSASMMPSGIMYMGLNYLANPGEESKKPDEEESKKPAEEETKKLADEETKKLAEEETKKSSEETKKAVEEKTRDSSEEETDKLHDEKNIRSSKEVNKPSK